MRKRHIYLLASASSAELLKGRYMRSPDGDAPAGGAPAGGEPSVSTQQGVDVVQLQGDPAAQEKIEGDKNNGIVPPPARPEGLPEGFESWEAYGQAVAK